MSGNRKAQLSSQTVPRSLTRHVGSVSCHSAFFSSLVVRRRASDAADETPVVMVGRRRSAAAGGQMRISTTSASELWMLLNVFSGAFGSSDASVVVAEVASDVCSLLGSAVSSDSCDVSSLWVLQSLLAPLGVVQGRGCSAAAAAAAPVWSSDRLFPLQSVLLLVTVLMEGLDLARRSPCFSSFPCSNLER